MRDLSANERRLVDDLGECFNSLARLEASHPSDLDEFAAHIHALQNIVLARPATEVLRAQVLAARA